MKKHLSLLMLLAALIVPWASKAQDLVDYTFSTGVDASKWITLSSSATQLFGAGQDDQASSLTNIGFAFPFGGDSYTQFWVSTNGIVSFSQTTSTGTTAGQFTSSYYNTAQPKICGVARDLGTCTGGYIKYELTGTAPERVLVVEFKTGSSFSSSLTADVNWQVQLHEDSSKVVIVYGSNTPGTIPSSYQTGLGVSGSDFYTIDPGTHAATHHTTYYATTTSTWHGANRYYEFTRPVITCPKPVALRTFNLLPTETNIGWTPGGTETEWVYSFNGGDWLTANDSTIFVDTLTSNTYYTVRVRAVCGMDDTSLISTMTFRTPCSAVDSLPWTYGFEDASGTGASASFNACLGRHTNYSSAYPYTSSTQVHGGTYSLYYYATTAYYSYLTLPLFDEALTNLQLSFWGYKTSATYGRMLVGVMSDPNNINTFDTIDEIYISATSQWEYFEVPLSAYAGTGNVIAILVPNSGTNYVYIDDLTVDLIPTCTRPTGVTLDTNLLTTTSASFEIEHAEASTFMVVWRLVGGLWDTLDVNGTTFTINGLLPGYPYEGRAYTICGDDTTMGYAYFSFSAGCSPISVADLPYSENFEAYSSGSTFPINACWTKGTNNSTAYPYPTSTAVNGQRSLYFYGYRPSSGTNTYSWAALPPLDETLDMNTLMLTLNVKRGSTASNYYTTLLYIGVADSVNGFVNADSIEAQVTWIDTLDYFSGAANSVHEAEVSFADYLGYGKYVVIYAPTPALIGSSTYCYNYAYVDDVVLRALPTCFWPSDIEVVSAGTNDAVISWTPDSRSNATSWSIEYGPHGFTVGQGTTETATDTITTLTGLTANTQYDVYVSAICGSDVSDPVSITFFTACEPFTTVPYTENFDNVTGYNSTAPTQSYLPNCWDYFNHGTRTNYMYCPYVYNSSSYSHSGSNCIRFYSYNGSGDSTQYLILPEFDSTMYPLNTLQLRFWLRAYSTSTSYHADVVVGVMTNIANESSFVPVATVGSSSTTYAEYEVPFGTYAGNHGRIALKFPYPQASSNYEYGYVDDITVEPMPSCPAVVDIEATATSGAAMLTWNYQTGYGAPNSYAIVYDSIGGTTPTTVTATETNVILTNLEPRTSYKAYVTAQCNEGNGRTDSVQFTTGPTAYIDLGGGTGTSYYLPVGNFYNYSYTQQIVTAAEMGGAATLTGIDFQYSYATPMTDKTNCTIYLANTTTTSLSSSFVTYNASTFVQVYSGSLNCSQGWNHFDFTTPFQYDGTSNLLIVVHDNSGDYNGSSYTFATHTAPSGYGRYVQTDSSPYTITSVSGGSAVSYRANMHLHKVDNNIDISCGTPLVFVTPDDSNDVLIRWVPGYHETSWDLEYRADGDTGWTNVVTGTSLTSYTILMDDLQPMTEYTFRVTPYCTDTNMPGIATYTTPCSYVSIPYYYGFEGLATSTTSAHPNIPCWNHLNNGSSYPGYPTVSSSTPHTGTRNLYWYMSTTTGSYGDYEIVVLPPVDINTNPINTLQLSFWARPTSTSYTPVFLVGVMTDPSDPTTFQNVSTVNLDHTTTDWAPYEVSLAGYTGNGHYVAIRANRPSSYWYAYMDDIALENLPDCPRPTGVNATNITQNAATIEWDSVGDYDVEYGPMGFTHGNGTIVSALATDSVDITGLTANTPYDVYVRAICSTDSSNWSFLYSFRTACALIDSLPYVEDFEGYGSGSTVFPSCWYKLGSTADRPYVHATTSYGHNNSHGLYFYAASSGYCYAVMPPVDSNALDINTLQVNFWARQYSTSYNCSFAVGVMTNPADASTFVAIDTVHPEGTTYEEFDVSLASYTGSGNYIAFRSILNSGSSIYMMLDDVTLNLLPACPRVVSAAVATVLLDSATIYWVDTSDNASWFVEYDTMPFAPGTGHVNPIAVTDTFYTFSGLDSATTYYAYIYPDCGTAIVDRMVRFTTLAASPATVPYTCDFEAAGPNGWDLLIDGQTNYWMVGNATNNGGSRSLYVTSNGSANAYSTGSISYSYAVRVFNLTDVGEYAFSYDWKGVGESHYYDFTRVFMMPAGENLEAGTVLGGTTYSFATAAAPANWFDLTISGATPNTLAQQSSWTTASGTFIITTPGTYKMVFVWANDGGGGTNPPTAIDNVSLHMNTCPTATGITSTSSSTSSITVDWTDVAQNIPGWEVRYKKHGTTNTTVISTTSHPVTISGLESLSTYDIQVRVICGVGDTSDWSPVAQLTTEMCDNANVAFTGAPTSTSYYIPVNNYYNYTLSETIIDSAELAGMGDITVIAYDYAYSSASTAKTNVTIYLQPTIKSVFSSSSDIITLNTATARQVYHGPLNCSQGWNYFSLDTAYTWDGHSNLVVIVDDNSGDYDDSEYNFNTSSCSGYKTLVWYSDSYNPDPTSTSYSGTKTYYQYRPTMKLISCGSSAPACPAPTNLAATGDYQSATVTWNGTSASYEVAIVQGTWSEPSSGIAVSGTTYTFSGLNHSTSYSIGVRGICTDGTMSDWVLTTFVTDVLPCEAPTNVAVNNITYTSADLSFTAGLGQNSWVVNFMAPGSSTFDTVTATTMSFSNLASGTSYQVAVRALCTNEDSPWSDTVVFSTLTCAQVTGVTASNITGTTARISWITTGASSYIVDYGYQGSGQGQGTTSITVSATTVVLTGLDEETAYDVYVRGVCDEGVMGLWSAAYTFTTTEGGGSEPVYYNITVLASPTNAGTVSGGGSFLENSTTSISATANDGWTFTGWQDGNTDNPRIITVTADATYTAYFTDGVGIDEVSLEDVSLFPNPATSTVTIRAYGMDQVSIIDLNGRTVMTQRASDSTTTFDVSTLAKGTYFVRIVGEQATAVRKLVVK